MNFYKQKAYWAILIPAYLIIAIVNLNWAFAAGMVLVPAIVGAAVIEYSKTPRGLIGGYVVVGLLLAYLAGTEITKAMEDTRLSIYEGCIDSPLRSSTFLSDSEYQEYCSCVSDKTTWTVSRYVWSTFATFQEFEPVESNTTLLSAMMAAGNACISQ